MMGERLSVSTALTPRQFLYNGIDSAGAIWYNEISGRASPGGRDPKTEVPRKGTKMQSALKVHDEVYVATSGRYDTYAKGLVTKVTPSGQVVVQTKGYGAIRFGPDGRKIGNRNYRVWLETDLAKVDAILAEREQQDRTNKTCQVIISTINDKRACSGQFNISYAAKTRLLELVNELVAHDEPAKPAVTSTAKLFPITALTREGLAESLNMAINDNGDVHGPWTAEDPRLTDEFCKEVAERLYDCYPEEEAWTRLAVYKWALRNWT